MPVGTDDDSESSDKSEKKCKICCEIIDRRSLKNAVKCNSSKCSVVIHLKCFDVIIKVFCVEKKNWRCRCCIEATKSSGAYCGSCASSDMVVMKKENECLVREKDLLTKLLSELEYTVMLQKTKINDLEQKTVSTSIISSVSKADKTRPSSYSAAIKTIEGINSFSKSPVLLVKSTDKAISNAQVEKDVKSNIIPGALNININRTRLIKDGLLISCENQESLDVLRDNLNKKMGSVYNVCLPKKIMPRIIVFGVQKDCVENEELLSMIIKSNNLNASSDEIKKVTSLKFKTTFNIVLEVSPVLFSFIIKRGFLYVGWKKCKVEEHLNLPQCFNCRKFGHYKKDCRNDVVICPKCSGAHEQKDCVSDSLSCVNCKDFNAKFKTNLPTDHSASNPGCEFYKHKLDQLKSKINYDV